MNVNQCDVRWRKRIKTYRVILIQDVYHLCSIHTWTRTFSDSSSSVVPRLLVNGWWLFNGFAAFITHLRLISCHPHSWGVGSVIILIKNMLVLLKQRLFWKLSLWWWIIGHSSIQDFILQPFSMQEIIVFSIDFFSYCLLSEFPNILLVHACSAGKINRKMK